MKPYGLLKNLAISVLMLLTTSMSYADEVSGHIGGFLGLKILDSNDWPDLNRHFSMGVMFDIKKDSWPVGIVLDIMDTGDKHNHDGMEDLGHTTEYQFGVRKIFINQDSKIQPYLGGGVSFMYAEQEIEVSNITTKQDDRDVGGWFGAGMYYQYNPRIALGFDARYSNGKVNLFNKERDAGGVFAGVTAGYQF